MKKLLLSILLAVPFIANAQVSNPETFRTPVSKIGWIGTGSSNSLDNGEDGGYDKALDDNASTFWGTAWGGGTLPRYYQVDMLTPQTINGVYITQRGNYNSDVKTVTIETSNDGDVWTQQVGNFDVPRSTTKYITFATAVTCRYYKIIIVTNWGKYEFDESGGTSGYNDQSTTIAETGAFTTSVADNTAYDRTAWTITSNSEGATNNYGGDNLGSSAVIDNNTATYWSSTYNPTADVYPLILDIDMGAQQAVNQLSYVQRNQTNSRIAEATISYSTNGVDYTDLPAVTWANNANQNFITLPAGLTFRYLRISITKNIYKLNNPDNTGVTAYATTLAEFKAHYNSTLPVSLTAFTAKANGSQVNLSWTTASEHNADRFEVLRSADGQNFVATGIKKSALGTSATGQTYNAVDFNPLKGDNYYKLNQYDKDGKLNEQTIVAHTKLASSGIDIVAIQPVAGGVELSIYSPKAITGQASASGVMGQTLGSVAVKLNEGYNKVTVPASTSGLVIATLTTAEGKMSKKTMK